METKKGQDGSSNQRQGNKMSGRRRTTRRNSKKGKKGSGGQKNPYLDLLPSRKRKPYHSKLPSLPLKKVEEPHESCTICDAVIENIAEALTTETGHCHFDCAVANIREREGVGPTQQVSYIGRGTFAIMEQDEEGHYVIVKRIVWETGEAFDAMKKYVETAKQ